MLHFDLQFEENGQISLKSCLRQKQETNTKRSKQTNKIQLNTPTALQGSRRNISAAAVGSHWQETIGQSSEKKIITEYFASAFAFVVFSTGFFSVTEAGTWLKDGRGWLSVPVCVTLKPSCIDNWFEMFSVE